MANDKRAIILGAGLVGLSAAWRLSKNGYLVDIIEKKHYPGGMSASLERNGFIFDHGPHGYNAGNAQFYNIFKQIMDGNEFIVKDKDVRIKFQDKYYRYPLKSVDLLVKLNPLVSIQCFLSYLYTVIKNKIYPSQSLSAEQWITNHFGKKLYNIYFGPYTKKVWGIEPDQLSPNFARLRIPKMNLLSVLAKSFVNVRRFAKDTDSTYAPTIIKFAYPKNGSGAFPVELAEQIKQNNGNLHLSSEAEKIKIDNNKVNVIFRNAEGIREIQADVLISTIPIEEAINVMAPKVNSEILKSASSFKYRSAVILCMLVNKDNIFTPETLYFSDKFFTRVSDIKNYGIGGYPDGMTGLMCEIPCNFNDAIWQASDKYLLDKVVRDLEKENFITPSNVKDYFTIKLTHAYPVYTIGYDDNLEIIKKYLKPINNVFFAGRQAQFRYIDMDNAVISGVKTAEFILSGRPKNESADINREEYFY